MYFKESIPHQYNSGAEPVDSTSPIHGQDAARDTAQYQDLKAVMRRQASQIELLTRELNRTQSRVRDLESRLDQIINNLRSN